MLFYIALQCDSDFPDPPPTDDKASIMLHSGLLEGVKGVYGEPVLSDVILKAQGTAIPAHKFVLAAQSGYFKAMFQASQSSYA